MNPKKWHEFSLKTGQKIGERDTIPSGENICSPAGRISRWLTDCVQ